MQIQRILESGKKGNSELTPKFPAEMPIGKGKDLDKKKEFLVLSKVRLAAERQKIYSIMKDMTPVTRQRVFKLFNLEEKEEKKKERIAKFLCKYMMFAQFTFHLLVMSSFL